jgi:hypothetical protein
MSRTSAALLMALAMTTRTAAADVPTTSPERRADDVSEPGAALSAWASFRVGVAHAPFYSATLSEVRSEAGQARLLRLGGATRLARVWWIGADLALANPGIEQPAGSYRAASAWGNPILFAETRRDFADSGVEGRLRLSGGLPLAERGSRDDLLDRRALAIGDALEGMSDPEFFTPEVLPLAVAGSLLFQRERWRASVRLELPLLLRLSDESVPKEAATSSIAFVPNFEPRVTAWPWRWFGLSLGGTLTWPLVRPVHVSPRRGPAQAMVAPRLLFAIRPWVLIALDVDVAAGGPLSGTASGALGARIAIE